MYKPSRFHVAVRLFSNRSQRTSKRGKNISDTLGYLLVCHVLFLPDFWCNLWYITEQAHGNMNPFVNLLRISDVMWSLALHTFLFCEATNFCRLDQIHFHTHSERCLLHPYPNGSTCETSHTTVLPLPTPLTLQAHIHAKQTHLPVKTFTHRPVLNRGKRQWTIASHKTSRKYTQKTIVKHHGDTTWHYWEQGKKYQRAGTWNK